MLASLARNRLSDGWMNEFGCRMDVTDDGGARYTREDISRTERQAISLYLNGECPLRSYRGVERHACP